MSETPTRDPVQVADASAADAPAADAPADPAPDAPVLTGTGSRSATVTVRCSSRRP